MVTCITFDVISPALPQGWPTYFWIFVWVNLARLIKTVCSILYKYPGILACPDHRRGRGQPVAGGVGLHGGLHAKNPRQVTDAVLDIAVGDVSDIVIVDVECGDDVITCLHGGLLANRNKTPICQGNT